MHLICFFSLTISAQTFEQQDVARIVVDSVELSNAFAGGLNAPQLSNVDLNNDGVEDILIFDRIGNAIIPMVRDGADYNYDPDYILNFPDVEHFMLLKDYNADGIADIFCYSVDPDDINLARPDGISVFKGKYTNDKIDFDLVLDPDYQFQVLPFQLANGSFSNLAVSNIDIPSIEDIDGDGDIDIVTFDFLGGQVHYYQNLVLERGEDIDGFFFIKKEDCYGGIYESGQSLEIALPMFPGDCRSYLQDEIVGTRHAGSTCLSIDHDADGDYELLLGDLAFNNITLLENGGDEDEAFFNRQIIQYPDMNTIPVDISIFPAAFYVDIDGDEVKDFVAAPNNVNNSLDVNNVWYYKNSGADNLPDLSLETKGLFVDQMVDLGTGTYPTFADVNGDGLQDLIVGTFTTFVPFGERNGGLFLFLNMGTATDPIFELTNDNWLDFKRFQSDAYNFAPTFADLDSDGDLDLYVGTQGGYIFHVENTAGPNMPMSFGPIITNYLDIDIRQDAAPTFYDLDKDGLLDMIVGTQNGNIVYFRNEGSSTSPNFLADMETLPNVEVLGQIDPRIFGVSKGYSKPTFVTYAGEDFIITGSVLGVLEMYRLDDDFESEFELVGEFLVDDRIGSYSAPAFADIDNDGFMEAIIGNRRGGLNSFQTDYTPQLVSVNPTAEQSPIKLRSNLVRDRIQVEDGEPTNFTIYSTLGQKLATGKNVLDLDVSQLSSGIYFVQMERNGVGNTVKFVKQ